MDITKNDDIMVSILTLAYNHEPYIRECLDGIVMQQTNFKFELLIHDDASTDDTAGIIREYERKYPDIIKPIYQKENQYSKKVPIGVTYLYPRAKGKYIALCEGDDYWTDPLKLQKQVDFLESHPDYVMCSHGYDEYIQEKGRYKRLPNANSSRIDIDTLIYYNRYFFQPLTLMYRLGVFKIDEFKRYENSRDIVLFYYLLTKGQGYYLSDKMSIYRRHNQGVWTGINRNHQWMSDYNVRISIYKVEKSNDSVIFLINLFFEEISRSWLFGKIDIILTIFRIVTLHMGIKMATRIIFNRLVKKKNPLNYLIEDYIERFKRKY